MAVKRPSDWAKLTDEKIAQMPKEKMQRYLEYSRQRAGKLLSVLEKHPEKYSYAADRFGELKTTNPKIMSRNAMMAELYKNKAFIDSKTSTLAGIDRVEAAQDEIFGFTPTTEQRKKIWSVFMEFKTGSNSFITLPDGSRVSAQDRYGSTRLQQLIAEEVSEKGGNLIDLMDRVMKKAEGERNVEFTPNVYTGNWNPNR